MEWREAERAYTDEVIGDDPLPRLFEESASRHADRIAQRYKGGVYDRSVTPDIVPAAPDERFAGLSYGELRHIVRRLAAGLRDYGMAPGDRVAIYSDTRMEWAQSDLAALAAGGVVTTIYESASAEMVSFILEDAGAVGAIVEDEEKAELVRAVADEVDLSFVVTIDETDGDLPTLADIYEAGTDAFDRASYDEWVDEIAPDDLASLIYTSGTTGHPKGVRLTHANIRANLNQIRKRYGPRPDKPDGISRIDETTRTVSFLPLAHVFERTAGHFSMFAAGASVAYAESADTLKDDFQAIQPTAATSVPRVYEKMYAAINEQAQSSAAKARIFDWAVEVGKAYHGTGDPGATLRAKHSLADRLVFEQVRSALGGELEMLISGGSSLSPDLCACFHGMGLPIYEGYGLTETAPVVTCNPTEEPKTGTIGPPVVDIETRLDPDAVPVDAFETEHGEIGELLVRGPNVSPGYWDRPDETAAAFGDDGWFRTGDIVARQPNGYFVFLGRVKEIVVLSTGKNVAPGPIEEACAADPLIEQAMVVGGDRKFIGGLIVPNFDAIRSWAAATDRTLASTPKELCDDPRVRERIDQVVDRVNENVEEVESIKDFRILPDEFTQENGLLTPTLKKRRGAIEERFEAEIAEIYTDA